MGFCCSYSLPESAQLDSNFMFFGGSLELAMFLRKARILSRIYSLTSNQSPVFQFLVLLAVNNEGPFNPIISDWLTNNHPTNILPLVALISQSTC